MEKMGIFWGVGVPAPNAQEQEHQINYPTNF